MTKQGRSATLRMRKLTTLPSLLTSLTNQCIS